MASVAWTAAKNHRSLRTNSSKVNNATSVTLTCNRLTLVLDWHIVKSQCEA